MQIRADAPSCGGLSWCVLPGARAVQMVAGREQPSGRLAELAVTVGQDVASARTLRQLSWQARVDDARDSDACRPDVAETNRDPISMVPAAGDLPVDGPAQLGAGQRRHRILALHARVRAARGGALRHQGAGQGPVAAWIGTTTFTGGTRRAK
jgi:hypothetical protein